MELHLVRSHHVMDKVFSLRVSVRPANDPALLKEKIERDTVVRPDRGMQHVRPSSGGQAEGGRFPSAAQESARLPGHSAVLSRRCVQAVLGNTCIVLPGTVWWAHSAWATRAECYAWTLPLGNEGKQRRATQTIGRLRPGQSRRQTGTVVPIACPTKPANQLRTGGQERDAADITETRKEDPRGGAGQGCARWIVGGCRSSSETGERTAPLECAPRTGVGRDSRRLGRAPPRRGGRCGRPSSCDM